MIHAEPASDAEKFSWSRVHPEADEKAEDGARPHDPLLLLNAKNGFFVVLFGIVMPVFAIVFGTILSFEGIWRLFLLHPVETLLEAAMVLVTPYANLKCWSSICYNDQRRPMRLGLLNGFSAGVSLLVFIIAAASFALQYPLIDSATGVGHQIEMAILALSAISSLVVSLFLTNTMRKSKITRDAKLRTVLYSAAGAGLALTSMMIAEARPTQIRVAESMALSDDLSEKETGLRILRSLNAEREIKMNCADSHTAGLAGMFLPLNADEERRLYFAATGKPYRDRQSTNMSLMSNDYLRRHVVGPVVDGLSLHRSAIHGDLHPNTLSSSLNWTFVFKNKSYTAQQARAELALPEGAVISDLTLWIDGRPTSGAFSATDSARNASGENSDAFNGATWISDKADMPALITDLGRGRYLLQASPVPGRGELKVSVSITEPIKIDAANKATLGIPHFIDSNFALAGQHQLRLRSPQPMQSTLKSIKSDVTADGASTLSGDLAEADISNSTFSVRLAQPQSFQYSVAGDKYSGGYIVQERKERAVSAPKHLVVVVDASERMKKHCAEVVAALKKIPAEIKTSVLLAGDRDDAKALPLEDALKVLKEENFVGGQDNLHGIVAGAELAGESSGGAVMWIHGPQPGFNDEMYIMAPYAVAPKFYELALDDCLTDANEFFKNHREIGPFTAVERGGPLQDDLESFFTKWVSGARQTYIDSHRVAQLPAGALAIQSQLSIQENNEVAILQASTEVRKLIAQGKLTDAAKLGIRYHIVTPVSGAAVMQRQAVSSGPVPAPQSNVLGQISPPASNINSQLNVAHTQEYQSGAMLQGATNGTSADATVIYGINTSGTVRVNNLANLEALLNIIANGGEIVGIALGAINILLGLMSKGMKFPFPMGCRARVLFGFALLVIGLAIPGSINWLVASARDANLFE